jgi:hypothetical protein
MVLFISMEEAYHETPNERKFIVDNAAIRFTKKRAPSYGALFSFMFRNMAVIFWPSVFP